MVKDPNPGTLGRPNWESMLRNRETPFCENSGDDSTLTNCCDVFVPLEVILPKGGIVAPCFKAWPGQESPSSGAGRLEWPEEINVNVLAPLCVGLTGGGVFVSSAISQRARSQ